MRIFLFYIFTLFIVSASEWCKGDSIFIAQNELRSIAYSTDAKYFATGEKIGKVRLWDASGPSAINIKTYDFGAEVNELTFSKNTSLLCIAGNKNQIIFLNVPSFTFNKEHNTGHGFVKDVDFEFNDQFILSCGSDKKLKIWHTSNMTHFHEFEGDHEAAACEFSSNGRMSMVGGDQIIYSNLSNLVKEQHHETSENSDDFYRDVKFFSNERYPIIIQSNKKITETKNQRTDWDIVPLPTMTPNALSLHSASQLAAVAGDKYALSIFDRSGNLKFSTSSPTSLSVYISLEFHPDGRKLLAGTIRGSVVPFSQCCPYHLFDFNCIEICGDSISVGSYLCDNEIDFVYDGCDNNCNIMDDFQCVINSDNSTICSYMEELKVEFVDLERNGFENEFILTFKVYPPLHVFRISTEQQLKSVFGFKEIEYSGIEYDLFTGLVKFTFKIESVISIITFEFKPSSTVLPQYYATPPISFEISASSKPEIFPLYFYQKTTITISKTINGIMYALIGLLWLLVLVSMIMRSLAGLEAIFVIQFCWLTLLWIDSTFVPLISALVPLKYSSGYSLALYETDELETYDAPFTSQFNMSKTLFINNFNLQLILPVLCLIGLGVTQIRLKCFKRWLSSEELLNTSTSSVSSNIGKLKMHRDFASHCFLYCNLLNFVYLIATSIIFFRFGSFSNMLSWVFLSVSWFLLLLSLCLFIFFPLNFNCFYLESFRENFVSLKHYFIHLIILTLAIALLSFLHRLPFLPSIPFLLMCVYTAFKRPYITLKHNIRSIFNYLTMVCFISFCVVIQKMSPNERVSNTVLYLMFLLVLFGFVVGVGGAIILVLDIREKKLRQNEEENWQIEFSKQNKILIDLSTADLHKKMSISNPNSLFQNVVPPQMNMKNMSNELKEEELKKQLMGSTERTLNPIKIQCKFDPETHNKQKKITEEIRVFGQQKKVPEHEINEPVFEDLNNQIVSSHSEEESFIAEDEENSEIVTEIAKVVLREENKFVNYKYAATKVERSLNREANRERNDEYLLAYFKI